MSEQRSGAPDPWIRVLINVAGVVIVGGVIAIIIAAIVTGAL